MLRAAPLLHAASWVSACVVVIGALTAIKATLAGRVQTDAKSILAYAIMAQAGLLFVECGLGLHTLALIHLVGHGLLRAYQLIRAPSALADARMLAMASNGDHASRSAPSWDSYMRAFRPLLSDRIVDGGLVPGLFRLGHWLEQWEQRIGRGDAMTGHGKPNPNEVKPLTDLGPEGTAKTGEWGHAP